MNKSTTAASIQDYAASNMLALYLRVGLGIVFVIGGWNKLSQLLSTTYADKIVASYTGTAGYINQFFLDWMFGPNALWNPWSFLTLLSSFELLSGLLLLAGLLVRPLALIYAFLLWSFVFSLPVITTPGAEFAGKTYMAPAMFVQIRDIGLSGMMFVLYLLGSGQYSLDERLIGEKAVTPLVDWEALGLLMRLSLGIILVIGGLFSGMPNIKDFGIPGFMLTIVGIGLIAGLGVRAMGAIVIAMMLYYIATKINFGKSLIGNLNAVKREFAFIAAGLVLLLKGGGERFTIMDIANRISGSVAAMRS